MAEFQAWPKTPRWYRDIVITEKIDGTNGCVVIERFPYGEHAGTSVPFDCLELVIGDQLDEAGEPVDEFLVYAQSRKRLVTPSADNAGFAKWVMQNAKTLVADLGPGRHYGEWWGQGIQRGYGLTEKRFSLFNTSKWYNAYFSTPQLHVVPVLYEGDFRELLNLFGHDPVQAALWDLENYGSEAAPDFMNPEGVCIFHTASNQVYKATIDNDETPKGLL